MGLLYKKADWLRTRILVLTEEPLCRLCAALGRAVPAHHVDHIVPIDQGGAWYDRDNLQPLCHSCHSLKTLGDKGHTVRLGCDTNGVPVNGSHHWHRGRGVFG